MHTIDLMYFIKIRHCCFKLFDTNFRFVFVPYIKKTDHPDQGIKSAPPATPHATTSKFPPKSGIATDVRFSSTSETFNDQILTAAVSGESAK